MEQFYTYLHCKPDLTPFYVGKGKLCRAKSLSARNPHYKNIVSKYGKDNIQIIVFKKDSEESAFKSEVRLIKILRNADFELSNKTDGGEGTSGYKLSDEAKNKIRNKAIGRFVSEETRERMGNSRKGRKHTEETRVKMSLSKSHSTIETRKKISKAKKGQKYAPVTLEARKNKSIAMTGNKNLLGHKHSDESRKKMSIAQMGRTHSEETKLKMRESRIKWLLNHGRL